MWKYVMLFQAIVGIVKDSPEFIETINKLIKAVRDHLNSGSASVMDLETSANVVCNAVFGEAVGLDSVVQAERRRWLELIQLLLENWDKIAPIFIH